MAFVQRNPLEERLVDHPPPVVGNRRPVVTMFWVTAAAALFGAGVVLMMPSVTQNQKSAIRPLTLKEVFSKFPRPENVHELNAFFAQLPEHDQPDIVYKHVAPHAKLLFHGFLEHHGTTAPNWKTGEDKRIRRHQFDDATEFEYRFGIFTAMLQKIIRQNAFEAKHNLNPNRAVFGVTKFADWTWTEFQSLLKSTNAAPGNNTKTKAAPQLRSTSVSPRPPCSKNWAADYRELFPARNQGQCGSCYAHAAVEELRAMAFLNTGIDPGELSVQFIIDCKRNGCNGGDASDVMDWVRDQGGVPKKGDYGPYLGHRGVCKRGVPNAVTTSGAERHRAEPDTAATICAKGPTSMGVLANEAFQMYMHGVLSHHSCPAGQNNHDTQAVAILEDQGAWLIRNSWGADWGVDPVHFKSGGEAGFILLEYGHNTCGVEQLNGIPMNVAAAHGCTGGSCEVPTPAPGAPEQLCENTCTWASDGACDDGGSHSQYSLCDFGSDCTDCGPRTSCTDTCPHANDGQCDEPSLCVAGTDCTDCQRANNPCASCTAGQLGPGQFCVQSANDGTCSTPDDRYWCYDSHDRLRVFSC